MLSNTLANILKIEKKPFDSVLLTSCQEVIPLNHCPCGLLTPKQQRCCEIIGCPSPEGPQSGCFIGCLSCEGQHLFAVQLGQWRKKSTCCQDT